jgi:hypothetical protein
MEFLNKFERRLEEAPQIAKRKLRRRKVEMALVDTDERNVRCSFKRLPSIPVRRDPSQFPLNLPFALDTPVQKQAQPLIRAERGKTVLGAEV